MEQNYRYTDAFQELQAIVNDIEEGEVSVDVLAEKIKRASQLIGICKAKLMASEEEVDRLLSQLMQSSKEDDVEEGAGSTEEGVADDLEKFIDEEG